MKRFEYLKMRWYFRKKLAQIYIFDFDYDDIICLALNEKECKFLVDEMNRDFNQDISSRFSIGDTLKTNIKAMLNGMKKK